MSHQHLSPNSVSSVFIIYHQAQYSYAATYRGVAGGGDGVVFS